MADEATINFGLSINKDNLRENIQTAFRADVATGRGPSPGSITVDGSGVDVEFNLIQPALTVITNLDDTAIVQVGIRVDAEFYSLLELLPGESYPVRLSRDLMFTAYTGTGTDVRFHVRSNAECDVVIRSFEV